MYSPSLAEVLHSNCTQLVFMCHFLGPNSFIFLQHHKTVCCICVLGASQSRPLLWPPPEHSLSFIRATGQQTYSVAALCNSHRDHGKVSTRLHTDYSVQLKCWSHDVLASAVPTLSECFLSHSSHFDISDRCYCHSSLPFLADL